MKRFFAVNWAGPLVLLHPRSSEIEDMEMRGAICVRACQHPITNSKILWKLGIVTTIYNFMDKYYSYIGVLKST